MGGLPQDLRSSFALSLQEHAKLTWRQITLNHKHSHGLEPLPKNKIKKQIPVRFSDAEKFHVLRYSGDNRPMVGLRVGKVFHVLWIERDFGDVYDH